MAIYFPRTAHGRIVPASPEEIAKEDTLQFLLYADSGLQLVTDSGDELLKNVGRFGYTNLNLHRRIDNEAIPPQHSHYTFVHYDENGNPYPQSVQIGVWDGLHSYRTTTSYIHDEESETCEIP